jgi:hypothetical protein
MLRTGALTTILALAAATAGCGDDGADGTIQATVYGESFVEDGIPASAFSDGWAVTFDKFLVSIGNVKAQAGHHVPEIGFDEMYIVDLARPTNGQGTPLATFTAPAGTYDHYGYVIRPDAEARVLAADSADAEYLKERGASIRVVGTATKGDVTLSFDWSFGLVISHAHCDVEVTIDGNDATVESTIHADHLFYDDAVSAEPALAFDLIASADGLAGAGPDGVITLNELDNLDIRNQTRYQVGSQRAPDGSEITNLRQYLELQVSTIGHIDGEGHCDTVATTP